MTRNRTLVNELSNDSRKPVGMVDPAPVPLWRRSPVRLQLVRAVQVQGDQFVGVQGVSEFWLFVQGDPDCGHGYVVSDDARGLLLQLCAPDGKHAQQVFIGWSNVAGITERAPRRPE